ncbi:hypothetical protein J3F83DRAFT_744247 [Trichoderma novae-zelandiae]
MGAASSRAMSSYGKNLERAHRFLKEYPGMSNEEREGCQDFSLSNGEIFVIQSMT